MDTKIRITIFSVILIAALGFIVYANSLNGKFVYDDEYLVKDNAYIKSWSRLHKVFTEDVGSGADRAYSFYRPVLIITYALDYPVWKLNVFGYHLTNVMIHILAALCVLWLVNALFRDTILALFTAVLFVVHPVHTEAVSYISGRSDPLGLIFLLITFILYLKQEGDEGPLGYILMLISYALALLSRENSLILPVFILIYHYAFRKKIKAKAFASLLALAIAYIAIRLTLLQAILAKIVYTTTVLERLPGAFVAIFNYVRLLFLPIGLHMEYNYIKASFLDPRAICGLVILIAAVITAIGIRKRNSLASFAILWFFAGLMPVLNIYPINAYMAEHWLYLPSVGFFLIIAQALVTLYGKRSSRILGIAILVFLTAFYSALTIWQNNYWKDPIYFYLRTLKYSPKNFGFYTNLGREYVAVGEREKALEAYKKALEIEPRFALPYNNIGNIYLDMGRLEEAVPYYKKSLELDPNQAFAYNNLGNLYLRIGKYREAIPLYRKAVQIFPNNAYIYNNLGKACASAGLSDEAEGYYKKSIDIDPNCLYAYTNLGELYLKKGDAAQALKYYDQAVRMGAQLDPALVKLLEQYRK